MKLFIATVLLSCSLLSAAINPNSVAILYNSQDPESETLARYYANRREIPEQQLVGLPLPLKDELTRSEYNKILSTPLRSHFVDRGWWQMGKTREGGLIPVQSKITTLVCIRGVPFKIKRDTQQTPPNPKLPAHFAKANEAAVDSELAMLSAPDLQGPGPINNPYFKKDIAISKAKLPFLLLVGRIDGPDDATCRRMIDDAIATEKRGLWGMCYLDHAKKGKGYVIGDQWLESIADKNADLGIPTVIDKNKQTLTTNYPMSHAAYYFGWYTTHRNGPLLNPRFKFRRGAVAVHLHSYSASHLRHKTKNWCGPLLDKGAAATLGNVYEPYLHLTHHLDVFYDRLSQGYSLVEAAYMACPALSWQALVLGDPLYRPMQHLDGGGQKNEFDRDYRAMRMASQLWKDKPDTMVKKLRSAAANKGNAHIYEYLGLWHRHQAQPDIAIAFFQSAAKKHMQADDRMRQWLHAADIQRSKGDKSLAIATLKKAQQTTPEIPEKKSLTAWLNILDPPAPPPAKVKTPENKP